MPKTLHHNLLRQAFLTLFLLCGISSLSAQLNVTLTGTDVLCRGLASGSIVSQVSGGTAPYTYEWSNGATTAFIENVLAGTYSVSVTDADGNMATASETLTEPEKVTLTLSADQQCVEPFVITADGDGGIPPYTYNWSTGETTQSITVNSGNYCVTIVDANLCGTLGCIDVEINPPGVSVVGTDANCFGSEDGTLTATPSAGTPPYTYAWSNGSTGAMITGLSAGTYGVTLTDASGCTAEAEGTISEPPQLNVTASNNGPACPGEMTNLVMAMPSGGTPPYTYLWSTGATTQAVATLGAGTYSVTLTDANNCTAIDETIILESTPPEVSITGDLIICGSDNTTTLTATATSGTPGYQFEWSTGALTASITNVGPGTYSVTATDANGCTDEATATVSLVDISVSLSGTDITCEGDDDGTATATVSGGSEPYTYQWSNGGTTATITGLAPGTYGVTVTEDNGCKASGSVTITEPDPLSATADVTNVLCPGDANGAIDLTVSGGTPPYTFSWSNGATTEDIDGLAAGTYTGSVTDANGCMISASVTVTEPSDISITAQITNVLCNGEATGAIDITVEGGTPPYTYSWSNGATTQDIDGLVAGEYTGTVTDDNGCMASATVTVTEPPAITATAVVTNVLCFGEATGAIDLTVEGGTPPYSFSWSNGATTEDIDGLTAGTYTGTVTDDNGCMASATLTVTELPNLNVTAQITDVLCNGDSTGAINLTVTGGVQPYTFSWSNGATTEDIDGLPAGEYTGTVTDDNGCMASATLTVGEPPAITATAQVTNVDCKDDATGAIDLMVSGGTPPYTYSWSNGATTQDIDGLVAGEYTGTVTDANGCMVSATLTVTEPPLLTATAQQTDILCKGDATGSIDITPTGGTPPYTYVWSNGETTQDIDGLTAGSYTGSVEDANGCLFIATFTITEPDLELTVTSMVTDEVCVDDMNGAIDLTVSGGTPPYTFNWSNGATTEDLNGLAPGIYEVTVTDDNDCPVSLELEVGEGIDTGICGAEIGNYVWEDRDYDGLQDMEEPGVPNVTVNLKNAAGMVIATTTTDENGFYLFDGLAPGTYSVQFVIPEGFDYTQSNIGMDDEIDSDIIAGMNGMTGTYDLEAGESNLTVDGGIIVPPEGAIADPCNCLNNATSSIDGQFSEEIEVTAYSGDTWVITGVTNMYLDDPINDPPAVPQLVPVGVELVEEPIADRPGFSKYTYSFRLIDAFTYVIELSNGVFDFDYTNTCEYPDISFDSELPEEICVFDAPIDLESSSPVAGDFTYTIAGQEVEVLDPSTLPTGAYNLEVRLLPSDPEECEAVLMVTFDITDDCPAKIGDFVWNDLDFDGIQDPGEPGIPGVTVTVTSQDESYTDTQVTDENGMYMFMVDPGTYKVTFEKPGDLIGVSPQDAGGDDSVDSDVDPVMLMTEFITVGPDEVNLTIDAGFYNPCIANIEDPGTIGFDQEICGPGNVPDLLVEVTPATGGIGEINYLWMYNTEDPSQDIRFWHPIPGSDSPNFQPGPLYESTYFTRCVRRNDCPFLESNVIYVEVGDDAVATIDGPNLVCEGETVTYSAVGAEGANDIDWSFSGPAQVTDNGDGSVSVRWTSFGIFSATLKVTDNGCVATRNLRVNVITNPATCGAGFTASGTINSLQARDVSINWMLTMDGMESIFMIDHSVNGADFENVGTLSAPTEIVNGDQARYVFPHVSSHAGRNFYRVRMYDAYGNEAVSNVVEFMLAEETASLGRIFPNPAVNDMIHVEMLAPTADDEAEVVFQLFSGTGNLIATQTASSAAYTVDLPFSDQAAGIYFLRITCGDKTETHRVMIND